jgi:tRNA 2-thiouridine synthesizing protein A
VVTLDLCGEVCPYTFVRTKLALETLAEGAVLTVVVDHAPAADNVPRACREAGHDVLSVQVRGDGRHEIQIRKRAG